MRKYHTFSGLVVVTGRDIEPLHEDNHTQNTAPLPALRLFNVPENQTSQIKYGVVEWCDGPG